MVIDILWYPPARALYAIAWLFAVARMVSEAVE